MAILLHHLQTFVTVAESGSMPEAARRLHCTQPTVSKHLSALESAIGAPLLDHDGPVRLTGDGARVLSLAGEMLQLAGQLRCG